MYETSDIRKNLKVQIDGEPYIIVDFQFVKPGKGQAFTRTKMRNMITGFVIERTYRSGEKLEKAALDEHKLQFLYSQGNTYQFMNTSTYDQLELTEEQVGDAVHYLIDNQLVDMLLFSGRPIGISLPNFVTLRVVQADPWIKGDTAAGSTKPVTLETGYVLQVPLFVVEGETLKIDTRTGSYVERVK